MPSPLAMLDALLTGAPIEPAELDVFIVEHSKEGFGDVVRVRVGSAAMIHRITDIEDGPSGLIFTTQGDNVERPDPPVSASAIDGRVVFAVPFVGLPVVWLKGTS